MLLADQWWTPSAFAHPPIRPGRLFRPDPRYLALVARCQHADRSQIDAGAVYVADDKGLLQAFDKSTGGTLWKQDVSRARLPAPR